MTASTHDELRDLVAAYALDAVEADDARLVEDHLRGCPRCRSELAAHRETAALLAHSGGEAPPGVWDRIAAEIHAEAPPALAVVVGDRRGSGDRRRRRASRALAGLMAAAAAVALVVLGVTVDHQSRRLDRLNAALAAQQTLQRATAAALDPRARRVVLASPEGGTVAVAALLPGGTGYVIPAALGALPPSRTYQMWWIVDGRPVSAGLMGSTPQATRVSVAEGATALAVSDEPAGGSRAPTTAPVASAAI
ncbi:MAG TPA: anti-sigma factor [Acidimicrobiales bacterium]|nr:anti-sigma factor [Acidimicrobiales bacterium]